MNEFYFITDGSVDINVPKLVELLNHSCNEFRFSSQLSLVQIQGETISHPTTHEQLLKLLGNAAHEKYRVVFFSKKRYDNNFFFNTHKRLCIVSFFGWDHLTSLPLANGLVYFIADILALDVDSTYRHYDTTGCIFDYLHDKRGVDFGMRAGLVCGGCQERLGSTKLSRLQYACLKDLRVILDSLSRASKWNTNVIEWWNQNKQVREPTEDIPKCNSGFDVFMCHNSDDKKLVRQIGDQLKENGIQPWLDAEQLRPGLPWQQALEQQIDSIASAAVFVGRSGIGPWQDFEIQGFLRHFIKRGCPVIPVVLSDSIAPPKLPLFLENMTWVDFREVDCVPLDRLIWGITGRRGL